MKKSIFLFGCIFCLSLFGGNICAQEPQQSGDAQGQQAAMMPLTGMSDRAVDAYLRANDPVIYRTFHRGMTFRGVGKGLLTGGIIGVGLGLATAVYGAVTLVNHDDSEYAFLFLGGVAVFSVGSTVCLASIPFSVVGSNFKRKAKNAYNRKYLSKDSALQIQLTGNGLGIALVF